MLAAWPLCISRLESELPAEDFITWLKPLQADADATDQALVLYAPNAFVMETVRARYLDRIEALLRLVSERPQAAVRIEVGSLQRAQPPARASRAKGRAAAADDGFVTQLEAAYTFDNYVEGKSNQLARSAAWQVAQNPGQAYNPLVLYGATGLGKTHLMHAAGNLMRAQRPGMKVLYLRSEQFFSAMMKALQEKTMDQFKRQFQRVDALLLDDIQFFAGKNTTQEEFFHTFNALFDGKQQMILTCDRYPREVENLEPRLKSRLGWGLPVSIEPPDFETRAAILLSKARQRQIALPEDVAFKVANDIGSNVRDLEGALNTLAARSNLTNTPITLAFAAETLRDIVRVHRQTISIANIQKAVADYYQLRMADLLSKRRTKALARPRQIAMSLAKELTTHSLPEIGDGFGGRDHTTVLHACRQIRKLRDTDGVLREDWDKLYRKLTE
ncbi:MAG TPA: chromosomal replication initiator protein DnaA [Chiayiivirga sp.]|nr:chromosomal replication initiator protein DnaA [Chiayiivirga sp.]